MPITVVGALAAVLTKDARASLFVVPGFSNAQTVHADFPAIVTETAVMLVDLSDTTNWKHTNTGHVHLAYLSMTINPDTNYRGTIEVGFLSGVDATNGDFNGIIEFDFAQKSDTIVQDFDFAGHGFDCEANHHFGPVTSDSTLFQTDVNLLGPDGATSFPSGNGDLVCIIGRTAGTTAVTITLGYETGA